MNYESMLFGALALMGYAFVIWMTIRAGMSDNGVWHRTAEALPEEGRPVLARGTIKGGMPNRRGYAIVSKYTTLSGGHNWQNADCSHRVTIAGVPGVIDVKTPQITVEEWIYVDKI